MHRPYNEQNTGTEDVVLSVVEVVKDDDTVACAAEEAEESPRPRTPRGLVAEYDGWLVRPPTTRRSFNMRRLTKLFGHRKKQHTVPFPKVYAAYALKGPSPDDPLDYEPEERNSFVMIVMALVFIMLLFTSGAVLMVMFSDSAANHVIAIAPLITIVCLPLLLITYYTMACYAYGRSLPCNIILLVLGTIALTGLAAVLAAATNPQILFVAIIVTMVIVVLCFGLAFTSFDFTSLWLLLIVFLLALILGSVALAILAALGHRMLLAHIFLSMLAILYYALMLVIELQMVLGGRTWEYGGDDYAFAAFSIYSSIIVMFFRIVQLLSLLAELFDLDSD